MHSHSLKVMTGIVDLGIQSEKFESFVFILEREKECLYSKQNTFKVVPHSCSVVGVSKH